MTWQTAIILQILVSASLMILYRWSSLTTTRVFFGVGAVMYLTIALVGVLYSLLALQQWPTLPDRQTWLYLVIEGVCIPAAWLVQYRLIRHIGASNAAIASTFNIAGVALIGILALHEPIGISFLFGGIFIIASTLVSLWIRADVDHPIDLALRSKANLLVVGTLFYSVGMYAEKQAISGIGVWNYTTYGWAMQATGALAICVLYGRREFAHIDRMVIGKGATLGILTAISGGFYVYALSLGDLSRTILATGGKIAITLVLAAILVRERNALGLRILALALSVIGLLLIL